jgi:hypothetical protein
MFGQWFEFLDSAVDISNIRLSIKPLCSGSSMTRSPKVLERSTTSER